MKRRDERVVTYETGHEDFLIDAVEIYDRTAQEMVYEAWVYRERMGMKMLMFGVPARANGGSFDGFCACLEGDDLDEYYSIYDEEVC